MVEISQVNSFATGVDFFVGIVAGALSFVTALAWNEAFRTLLMKDSKASAFIYAIVVTIVMVLFAIILVATALIIKAIVEPATPLDTSSSEVV